MSDDPKGLVRYGWNHRKTGKAALIQYETANDRIGYRYKGAKRTHETSKAAFLRNFKNDTRTA